MKSNRIISLLLVLATLLCSFSFITASAEGESEVITVIAGSDFQNPSGNTAGKSTITKILSSMAKDGITKADGFLFCGDYSTGYDNSVPGLTAVKDAVKGVVSENMIFVKGNHDPADTAGLSKSGANDHPSGGYGVFVINESDYMWYNNSEGTVKRTAQKLTNYLNEKLKEGYDKPIFVVSHLQLNYNMRTKYDGDGKHANYIFDVLNAAGEKGLNIFFLFGHNHSNGWDDYLGGSSVYLEKGDKILIAQNSGSKFKEETLNFTYMNAGYTGYYNNVNGADDTLTMSAFVITDDSVTVTRYSPNGIHDLKTKGVKNEYKNESAYEPNDKVYASPREVPLSNVKDKTPIPDLIPQPQISLTNGARLDRISATSQITEGKYLLVYNSDPLSVMLPNVVSKANASGTVRVGFDLEQSYAFGADSLYGDWTDCLWQFTPQGEGWLIGNGDKFIKLTYTTDKAITATLEDEGTVMQVGGSEYDFTFKGDGFNLNYNDRGLINAFSSNPAKFMIYKFNGYSVEVENGTAPEYAKEGDTVTVTAKIPNGYTFDGWSVVNGGAHLEDPSSESTSFTMPGKPVKLRAKLKAKDGESDEWNNPYKDVKQGEWYFDAVRYVSESDLMNGTGVGVFAPSVQVNRAMIVTVLYRLADSPDVSRVKTPFTDVKASEWYAPAIAWAYKNGVVNGTSGTTFSPTNNLTREQFATILYRYADEVNGIDTAVPSSADLTKYTDSGKVSSWARTALVWANHNGYISGVSATLLSPESGATRAQMATILHRYIAA